MISWLHPLASANAPWTRTIVGFAPRSATLCCPMLVGLACAAGLAHRASAVTAATATPVQRWPRGWIFGDIGTTSLGECAHAGRWKAVWDAGLRSLDQADLQCAGADSGSLVALSCAPAHVGRRVHHDGGLVEGRGRHTVVTMPPSIRTSHPVTLPLVPDASSSTICATSSGRVKRRVGVSATAASLTAAGSRPCARPTVSATPPGPSQSAVSTGPGLTVL